MRFVIIVDCREMVGGKNNRKRAKSKQTKCDNVDEEEKQ